jgi:YARHG domain
MHLRLLLPVSLVLALACAGGTTTTTDEPTPEGTEAPDVEAPAEVATPARPLYYETAIQPADLDGRSLRELALMRNTIFARVGHSFHKKWLRDYFTAQPWYTAQEPPDYARLTPLDKQNAKAIGDYEAGIGGADLLRRKADLHTRLAGAPPNAEDALELTLIGQALGEWGGDAQVAKDARNPLEDPTVLDAQLTTAQISDLSRRDLRLLRNTIFARHGRTFDSMALATYFEAKPWYKQDANYSDRQLTEIDQRNLKLITSQESAIGGAFTENEHLAELGLLGGA